MKAEQNSEMQVEHFAEASKIIKNNLIDVNIALSEVDTCLDTWKENSSLLNIKEELMNINTKLSIKCAP